MWNDRLVRELGIVLAIKLVALYLIWQSFFSAPAATSGEIAMEQVLLTPGSVIHQEKD